MQKQKKIEKVMTIALNDDLTEYVKLVKILKKNLPFIGGTKRVAAALLKEYLGDISNMEISKSIFEKSESGKIVFDDIKDGKARLFINIGKNHKLGTGDLIREIVKRSGIDGKLIGKIDLHSTYSFFEVPEQYAELVVHSFDNARIKGVPAVVEPAKRKKKESEE